MKKHSIAIILLGALLSNCLTISTVVENFSQWDNAFNKAILYSGTRESNPVIPGDFYMGNSALVLVAFFGFAIIDPPISFVLDTALLPITIPWALYEENRAQDYKCDCFDRYSAFEDCKKRGSCKNPDQSILPEGRTCRPKKKSKFLGPFCVLRYQ